MAASFSEPRLLFLALDHPIVVRGCTCVIKGVTLKRLSKAAKKLAQVLSLWLKPHYFHLD